MHIQVFDSFSALPREIVDNAAYPAQRNFFLTLDWYHCLHSAALRESVKPRIYCATDGTATCILYCGVNGQDKTLRSLTSFYSLGFGIAAANGEAAPTAVEAIVEFISNERPRWNSIELRYLVEYDENNSVLIANLNAHGFNTKQYFQYENWYLDVGNRDFATYYSGRSSRLKNTIKRKEKKLQNAHNYRISMYSNSDEDLRKAADDFVAVYNNSWKDPEPFPEFIPSLVELAAKLGILRLGILYINETAAAAQLWITAGGTATIYKLAYIGEYADFSPGSILSREMFRVAIDDDRVACIDYGVGSENYKKDWMESVRGINGILAMNRRTATGLAKFAAETVRSTVKRIIQR